MWFEQYFESSNMTEHAKLTRPTICTDNAELLIVSITSINYKQRATRTVQSNLISL